jgi:acetoin utilization protein AcuB
MKTLAQVMKAPVITVKPQDSAIDLGHLARRHQIRHFPVVENDRLIGIVTDRTIREATTSPRIFQLLLDLMATVDRVRVEEIINPNVITAPPDMSLPAAAKLMLERKIGCLPVVKDGKLIGIVTRSDVLGALADQAQ